MTTSSICSGRGLTVVLMKKVKKTSSGPQQKMTSKKIGKLRNIVASSRVNFSNTMKPGVEINRSTTFKFTKTEYVKDVSRPINNTFEVFRIPVNPGLVDSFPWTSQIAPSFQKYRFNRLKLHYKTTSSTFTNGMICIAPMFNVLDSTPINKPDFLELSKATRTPIWGDTSLTVTKEDMSSYKEYFIRTADILTRGNLNLYDPVHFVIGIDGFVNAQNNETVGEIWIEYEIEFFQPKNLPSGEENYKWLYFGKAQYNEQTKMYTNWFRELNQVTGKLDIVYNPTADQNELLFQEDFTGILVIATVSKENSDWTYGGQGTYPQWTWILPEGVMTAPLFNTHFGAYEGQVLAPFSGRQATICTILLKGVRAGTIMRFSTFGQMNAHSDDLEQDNLYIEFYRASVPVLPAPGYLSLTSSNVSDQRDKNGKREVEDSFDQVSEQILDKKRRLLLGKGGITPFSPGNRDNGKDFSESSSPASNSLLSPREKVLTPDLNSQESFQDYLKQLDGDEEDWRDVKIALDKIFNKQSN